MTASSHSSSSHSAEATPEKATEAGVENVHTNERIPGQPNYYEKGGLRTYGDNEDHEHEPKVRFPPTQACSTNARVVSPYL